VCVLLYCYGKEEPGRNHHFRNFCFDFCYGKEEPGRNFPVISVSFC